MANTLAPFGFSHVGYLDGTAPTFAPSTGLISSSNSSPIYKGDPVNYSSGYLVQSSPGTTTIAGIFVSVNFQATSLSGQTRRLNYWPGSDALADGVCQFINNPNAIFMAQVSGGKVTISSLGKNVNFAIGTGSSAQQLSGATIDITTVATTSTLPFRIIGMPGYAPSTPWLNGMLPPGANGSDNTSNNNFVFVAFNNQSFKSLTAV